MPEEIAGTAPETAPEIAPAEVIAGAALPDDVLDAIQAQKPEFMKQLRESIKKNTPASMPAGVVVPASSVPATVTAPTTPAAPAMRPPVTTQPTI